MMQRFVPGWCRAWMARVPTPLERAVWMFAIAFLVYFLSPMRGVAYDSIFSIHRAYSLLHGHWGRLDGFVALAPTHYAAMQAADGHWQSIYPVGAILFAMPFVAIVDLVVPDLEYALYSGLVFQEIEAFVAAFYCALAGVLMWRLALRAGCEVRVAVIAAFIFAFASPIWSSASRGLLQHGPLAVCVLAAWLSLRRAEAARASAGAWIAITAFWVGMMFVTRSLAMAFVVAFTVHVAWFHRRHFAGYAAVGIAMAVAWFAFNRGIYGTWVNWYYDPFSISHGPGTVFERVLGQFVSPSRGVFIFAPIMLLAVIGPIIKGRAGGLDRHDVLAIACIALLLAEISRSPVWWAGGSYGPRFMTDVVPFMVYLSLPAWRALARPPAGPAKIAARALAALALVVSVAMQVPGVFFYGPYAWNAVPQPVDEPAGYHRLWEWSDPQFLQLYQRGRLQTANAIRVLRQDRRRPATALSPVAAAHILPIEWRSGWAPWHGRGRPVADGEAALVFETRADLALGGRLTVRVFSDRADRPGLVTVVAHAGAVEIGRWQAGGHAVTEMQGEIPAGLFTGRALPLRFVLDPADGRPSGVMLSGLRYVSH